MHLTQTKLFSHGVAPTLWVDLGRWPLLLALSLIAGLVFVVPAAGQIPSTLTDKIYQGEGVINLLKDVSGAGLSQYLDANGSLLLGIDVNENQSGNESGTSLGIALKTVELRIMTTAGDFRFSDIFTNTTALIKAAGSTQTAEYFTVFGQSGSSQLTGSTSAFNLSAFDDVMQIRNVAFTGDILSAQLFVKFLDTGTKNTGANESFFDFSGGFEDFAILSAADANLLEQAAIGTQGAAGTVSFTSTTVADTFYSPPADTSSDTTTSAGTGPVVIASAPAPASPVGSPVPGAPVPPLLVVAAAGALLLLRSKRA